MDRRFMFYGGFLNLLTLLLGIILGFFIGSGHATRVHAQEATTPPVEEVSPNLVTASAAFGTLLANRAAIDDISIRGLDLAKFDQNILNLLASKPFFTAEELRKVVENSRSDKVLRMKQPAQPKPEGKNP